MFIEALESRIAPAAVLNFTDVDGDHVTIRVGAGDITAATHPAGIGDQIDILDATQATPGSDLIVTVIQGARGDGLVNIGKLDATGVDLHRIVIPGDLSGLDVGSPDPGGPLLESLEVNSLNKFSTATDRRLFIYQDVGTLQVARDILGAQIVGDHIALLTVGGDASAFSTTADVRHLVVRGNLANSSFTSIDQLDVAGSATHTIFNAVDAHIQGNFVASVAGDFTPVHSVIVGGLVADSALRASGPGSLVRIGGVATGTIFHGGESISIGGNAVNIYVWEGTSLLGIGGSVASSTLNGAAVNIGGSISQTSIGSRYATNDGGGGYYDGYDFIIVTGGKETTHYSPFVSSIYIGGSVLSSSNIVAEGIGKLIVRGNLVSSSIHADTIIGSVGVGGSISNSSIIAGDTLNETAGVIHGVSVHGNVTASAAGGAYAGSIVALKGVIGTVSIGGSLIGSSQPLTGSIIAPLHIGQVKIGHDLRAGAGASSGSILATLGPIGGVQIGGSLIGNAGAITAGGSIGSIWVHGNIAAATRAGVSIMSTGLHQGAVDVAAEIKSLRVDGSVSHLSLSAGLALAAAGVNTHAHIGSIVVGGDWQSSTVNAAVSVVGSTLANPGGQSRIDSIQIGGKIATKNRLAGTSYFFAHSIGSFSFGRFHPVLHSGAANDFTIAGVNNETLLVGEFK